MLRFFQTDPQLPRREILRLGGGLLGSVALPSFLGRLSASERPLPLTGKSVVFLFLHGGPSQIETFDPKMTAPLGNRSVTGEIATRLPGVTFGSTFPKLAAMADRLAIVRSFVSGDGNHDIKPVVGRDTNGANLGALYARVSGANHPATGMPRNVCLFPRAVDPSTRPEVTQFGKFDSPGFLGGGYAPFVPGAGGELQQNLQLNIPVPRLDDRQQLLSTLDRVRFELDAPGKLGQLDDVRRQAFSTILGGVAGAFDLSKEDPAVIERYDTAPLVRPDQISKKWNNYNNYVDNAKSLGKLMLLARRLCEAGAGFVTVTTSFVWDMHSDVNNAGVEEGMGYMGVPLDHAVATFLQDVEARGLSEKILLICCGEMGRTPRLNDRGGRDHWGNLAPLILAGGGIRTGQVVGQSSRDAAEAASTPIRNSHIVATALRTLMDPGEVRLMRGIPSEVVQAASAEPIPGIF
jgi:hypothetical protein